MAMNAPSPNHREILTDWSESYLECYERYEFMVYLPRVLAGDKPATILQRGDWNFEGSPFDGETEVLEFIEGMGLTTHRMNKDISHIVGCSNARFDLLPSTTSTPVNDAWHRRLGVVFGYSPEAIEWFINTPCSDYITPRDRVDQGDFTPAEVAYVDFLAYKHEDSMKGYELAIKLGKHIRNRISALSEEWNLPIFDRIAEEYYQLSLSVYSGERDYFPGEVIGFKMIAKNSERDT